MDRMGADHPPRHGRHRRRAAGRRCTSGTRPGGGPSPPDEVPQPPPDPDPEPMTKAQAAKAAKAARLKARSTSHATDSSHCHPPVHPAWHPENIFRRHDRQSYTAAVTRAEMNAGTDLNDAIAEITGFTVTSATSIPRTCPPGSPRKSPAGSPPRPPPLVFYASSTPRRRADRAAPRHRRLYRCSSPRAT